MTTYIDPTPFGGEPPGYSYGQRDWLDDWQWRSKTSLAYGLVRSEEFQKTILPDYFRNKYHEQAKFHYTRMVKAVNYVVRHMNELNEGRIGIEGPEVFVPSTALVLALWKTYNECPDNFLTTDWPVPMMKELAKKFGA